MTVAGSSVSANEVKPRRSLNMTVPSRCTPPRRIPSALRSTSSTTASGTKRAKASRACSRSKATVTPWIAAVARSAATPARVG